MTPEEIKEARVLVEWLDALSEKATPMDISTAEVVEDVGHYECAMCNGSGETWGNSYINLDGVAMNIQFSGIGNEFKANERFVFTLIEAFRSGVLTAALDEIERLRARAMSDNPVRRQLDRQAIRKEAYERGRRDMAREAMDIAILAYTGDASAREIADEIAALIPDAQEGET